MFRLFQFNISFTHSLIFLLKLCAIFPPSLLQLDFPHEDIPLTNLSTEPITAVGARNRDTTVQSWSAPKFPLGISSIYSAAMVTKLVKTYQDRISTNDPQNEIYYSLRRLGDNVWFNIERVAPFKTFIHWAINTSRVTDRYGADGKPLINNYGQNESSPCAPESAFHVPYDVIMSDDANERIRLNSKLNDWFRKNEKTPTEKLCNRFRGLQCNPSKRKCECENDNLRYITYFRTQKDIPGHYRDGCYIKPWRRCGHLSLDSNIPVEYKAYHAHAHNMKQFLFRMATPMPKTPRCEKGTYCVDMILNQKHPICWCSSRMYNKDCYNMNASVPLLSQFIEVRKTFHSMMIPERDRTTRCLLDTKVEDKLQDMLALLSDMQRNYVTVYRLMKEVIASKGKNGKFCDFRKGLACDPYKKTCTYRTGCGPGRVSEIRNGRKLCLINNGYPCPTIESQCVNGAECKDFGKGRHCHCSNERYGDLCRFEKSTFFGALLQSRVSGFVGYHFTNLQELVNHVLAPVERLMSLGHGKTCDPYLDRHAMSLVRYLGSIRSVHLEEMDGALGAVQYLVGKDEPLCDYRKFLGCTKQSTCEPLIPDTVQYEVKPAKGVPGNAKIHLTLGHKARCGGGVGNFSIPPIYQDMIVFKCTPHHTCRRVEGRSSSEKYCLCPEGFDGNQCEIKMAQVERIDVYTFPENIVKAARDEIIDVH